MKKAILLALLFVAGTTAFAKNYKYTAVTGDPMGVRIYTLDNGLKVYLSVNKENPRVSAYIAVNTGSKNDPEEYTGLAHYLEHLMFKGTKKFGTADYEAEKEYLEKITTLYEEYGTLTDESRRRQKYHEIDSISQMAAQYNIPNEYDKLMALIGSEGSNAYTSDDVTCYQEDIPSNEVERWAKIQADRFQNMVIRGFHTELEAVYEEKNISLSDDTEKTVYALMKKMFPSHSYGTQTVIGTQEHLKNPSIAAIQRYYSQYYVPDNMAILMAGDLDPDSVIAVVDKYFGAWEAGKNAKGRVFGEQPVFTEPQDTVVVGLEQEMAMLGWRFKGAADLQNDTLQVLSEILYNENAGLFDLDLNQKMMLQEADAETLDMKDYSILLLAGVPKQGQSLGDVRSLLLSEVEKVKKGDFDEDLLQAVVNNEKLNYLRQTENNGRRVSMLVDSYINGEDWEQCAGKIERMSHITKEDITVFANKYLTDGYVYVEKQKGEDLTVKKIDKPEITPIPSNRDLASGFLTELTNETVEPVKPQFVDFNEELTFSTTGKSLPVIYKQNNDNDLFTLSFYYPFGNQADNRYKTAFSYLDLLGTDKLSPEEEKKQFYRLACNYSVELNEDDIVITLTGLHENMREALALWDDFMQNAVPDENVYRKFVKQVIEERANQKLEQFSDFDHLYQYALHGERNDYTNVMTSKELKKTKPAVLTGLVKGLSGISHTVLYYGPATEEELSEIISANHTTVSPLRDAPANKPYEWTPTPANEVIIAPYKAKNIYMRMLNQQQKAYDADELPVITLFNEYFGGGMNNIVFQELRETRGLAYNAAGFYVTPLRKDDPEFTLLHIISQNDKMMDCINVFSDITANLPENEDALNIAKQSLMKSIASRRVTKYNVIRYYLKNKKLGLDFDINQKIYEQLPGLTMQDVADFVRENISGKPMHYIILGDEKELDMQSLEKIGTVKRVSIDDIYVR